MAIGAISAYGSLGAVSFRPYVYNANTLNASSMNKLSRISDDVLDKKIDYSELTDESLNENPLKKGQTLDFQGILAMQMRRGQSNAARIMKPMETAQGVQGETEQAASKAGVSSFKASLAAEDGRETKAAEASGAVDEAANESNDNMNYQMQQALRAYEMFMTA